MASIDFKTFVPVAHALLDAGLPVMQRGRHGIGKSQVVYQIAAERGLRVVERRASQMTEGDLMGLPSVKGEVTTWNPPDWFKDACSNAVLLFLDEVDRATLEVRQGIFELNDSRKLNGWHLHPMTVVMAAVNGGEHAGASSYQVGEMGPAELSRWAIYDLEPSVEDWLTYASGKVEQVVWDFIKSDSRHLEFVPSKGGFEPNKVVPDRRAWFRLNKTLAQRGLLSEEEPSTATLAMVYHVSCGLVGTEAAVAFRDFVENYETQVTVEDILVKGKVDRCSEWSMSEHMGMVDKIEASGIIQQTDWSDATLRENMAAYISILPGEAAFALFSLAAKCQDPIANLMKFHKTPLRPGEELTVNDAMNVVLKGGDFQVPTKD